MTKTRKFEIVRAGFGVCEQAIADVRDPIQLWIHFRLPASANNWIERR